GPTYTVRPGDGLTAIAARHGVPLGALLDANGLTIDSVIIPDQRLALPAGATGVAAPDSGGGGAGGTAYTVRPGDSLSVIASRHGVSLGALLGSTGLTVDSLILPGQQLTLPAGASQPSAAPAPATNAAGGLSYTVRAGDSLSMLASRHGVSLGALLGSTGPQVKSLILP